MTHTKLYFFGVYARDYEKYPSHLVLVAATTKKAALIYMKQEAKSVHRYESYDPEGLVVIMRGLKEFKRDSTPLKIIAEVYPDGSLKRRTVMR